MKLAGGILLALFTLLKVNVVSSQPGGGGGLQIMKIGGPGGDLINRNDSSLKVSYYMLSNKKRHKVKKEIFESNRALGYNYVDEAYTHIYLPPYIKKRSKNVSTPNQRLQLIYNSDTMTIDVIGIKAENSAGNTDRIEKIVFSPGYFKWPMDAQILSIRSVIDKHVGCADTLNLNNGYLTLCPDNIRMKDSLIDISVKTLPVIPDTGVCYKFFYYFIFNNLQWIDNGYKEGYSFFKQLQALKLTVNNRLFSGCLKIATMVTNVGISSRYSVYNVWVLYYNKGVITRQEYLDDVDLNTERRLERPTG